MIWRLFYLLFFTLGFGAKALACSCAPWGGGYASEFSKQNLSAWVIPMSASVETRQYGRWFEDEVIYELKILDSFGQVSQTSIKAMSSVEDGASCGEQLNLGVPHFLNLRRAVDSDAFTLNCMPEIPYLAIKDYLQNGKDSFVPSLDRCFNDELELSKSDLECKVWEDNLSEWRRYGDEDWFKYLKIWRAGEKSRVEAQTSKDPWWKFGQKK